MDLHQLSRFIKTTGDAYELQEMLEKLSNQLYRTDGSAQEMLMRDFPYDLAVVISSMASQSGTDLHNKSQAQNFFTTLQKSVHAIPTVKVTLAIKPKAELISIIHDWFYRAFSKYILLDIHTDPEILAGIILSINGKYYDYSLQKQSERLLTELKQATQPVQEPTPPAPVASTQTTQPVIHTQYQGSSV